MVRSLVRLLVWSAALAACGGHSVDPCATTTCAQPPPPSCDGETLNSYAPNGTCSAASGAPVCSYAEDATDCTQLDLRCVTGACVDPCAAASCDAPPSPSCSGTVLTLFPQTGLCIAPAGVVSCSYPPHTQDCAASGQVCANGACRSPVDPCASLSCDAPPADDCAGTVRHHYPPAGTCSSATGKVVCAYAPTDTDCATRDQACSAGACVDPCVGFGCTAPPSASCEDGGLTTFAAPGACSSPAGVPRCDYAGTQVDCRALNRACTLDAGAGSCLDPCAAVSCSTPPSARCAAGMLTTFNSAGTCSSPGGLAACTYAQTVVDCFSAALCDQAAGRCLDPCATVSCLTPPPPTCTSGVLTAPSQTGSCTATAGVGHCNYGSNSTDCAAANRACSVADAGACVDPCLPNPCTNAPLASCSGNTRSEYSAPGTCTSPGGAVACDWLPVLTDCTALDRVCSAGACVDPCAGVSCTAPPPDTCVGEVRHAFSSLGTCTSPAGVPGCGYTETTTDCAATGAVCLGGACVAPLPIGYCRTQFPGTVADLAGVSATIYGRVFVAGLTDLTTGTDVDGRVVAQVGLGSAADPSTWAWTAATPNFSYGPASPGFEANNDEYQASFTIPDLPGATLNYAFRFSGNGGKSWVLCDTGSAGSSDGFTQPGVLQVVAPFFSEYVEGSASNKAVEIFNPGASAFSLAGCSVAVAFNGAAAYSLSSIPLGTGTIAPGGVLVVCHTSYALGDAAQCGLKSGNATWNGDDVVALRCNGVDLDVIGQLGFQPPPAPNGEWGTALTSTRDNTLQRQCPTVAGDRVASDVFDPAASWKGYPTDVTFLGSYTCPLP